MKKVFYVLMVGIIAAIPAVGVYAQSVDWKTFEPKKATPEEMERVNNLLEENLNKRLGKTTGDPAEIKSLIMRGNKITTVVYNYGNITRPNTLSQVADLVWNQLGYGFEFTPLVAGSVTQNGTTYHILDDGMWLPTQGGYSPDGSLKWGWLPKPGYSAPGQPDIAAWSHRSDVNGDLTRKPHSWPESWYNSALGRYVWPAFLGSDATTPDEEVYFVVDDYTNKAHEYYPFPNDSTKRGLGLDMEVRFFQFNNPLAEDIIFLVYRVTNKSPNTIDSVWFGMYGDPHVGGYSDYSDDRAFFIPPSGPLADPYPQRARSMVYAWDEDNKGIGGLKPGYFGFKFLESPTNSTNGVDDDDDGLIDESPFNDAGVYIDGTTYPLNTGINDTVKYKKVYGPLKPRWSGDEDGDWDPNKDDVGIDGIPGTGDFGEGNGKPDIGYDANGNLTSEPDFGIRDVSESDQIGLKSFNALPYGAPNFPKSDALFFQYLSTDSIAIDQTLFNTPGDNIFLYGSGPFKLAPGATQRFSIALLMGQDLPDLILNAETAQRVLEANYRFAQPPPKPNLTVVPGKDRVTLYWDDVAEHSIDPLTGTNDFEGYKIYRSQDPNFSDVFTITDANGTPFLGKPFQQDGIPAQFDLVDSVTGLSPVEYLGRGIKYYLGSDNGLVHQYVDSSVTPGITYYYAVASYDRGFDSLTIQLPPSESQISIIQDPVSGTYQFDSNTGSGTPGGLPAGSLPAAIEGGGTLATRVVGESTGDVRVKILDDLAVPEDVTYSVKFDSTGGGLSYNVRPKKVYTEQFTALDTVFVPLSRRHIIADSSVVKSASGAVVNPATYEIEEVQGRIRGLVAGALQYGATYEISYQYYPVYESKYISGEDNNPVFDGIRMFLKNEPLGVDVARSGWVIKNNTNLVASTHKPVAFSTPNLLAPINIQIVWNRTDRDANGRWLFPGDTLLDDFGQRIVLAPFHFVNVSNNSPIVAAVQNGSTDSLWLPGREITFVTPAPFAPPGPTKIMYSVNFNPPATGPVIYPAEGDIYEAKTTKPFMGGDEYEFTTQAVRFDNAIAKSALDNIYVVPNPYVVYSGLERPGPTATKRGDQQLQFRNLPSRCTIRIYTMVGELVDTIEKDDNTNFATWDLLSYEGQRLAYGVYLYHVDVPGVGQKIGRFALIK